MFQTGRPLPSLLDSLKIVPKDKLATELYHKLSNGRDLKYMILQASKKKNINTFKACKLHHHLKVEIFPHRYQTLPDGLSSNLSTTHGNILRNLPPVPSTLRSSKLCAPTFSAWPVKLAVRNIKPTCLLIPCQVYFCNDHTNSVFRLSLLLTTSDHQSPPISLGFLPTLLHIYMSHSSKFILSSLCEFLYLSFSDFSFLLISNDH